MNKYPATRCKACDRQLASYIKYSNGTYEDLCAACKSTITDDTTPVKEYPKWQYVNGVIPPCSSQYDGD